MSTLDRALALAGQGIPVFPCISAPGDKAIDKSPAVPGGFKAASINPAAIRAMFAGGAELIGVPTGAASGFDVLDLDLHKGADAWWAENGPRIPMTRVHETRSGGLHILFKHQPGLRCSAGRIAKGCDVRADGGYVIHWPSASCDVWMDEDIAPWPAWLIASLTLQQVSAEPADPAALVPPSVAAVVDVLNRLPNPPSNGRDVYLSVMGAAGGCAFITGDDDGLIAEAAAEWAEKWDGHDGTDEAAKFRDDFSRRAVSGWPTLLKAAIRDIPGFAAEQAEAEFEVLPAAPPVPVDPEGWRNMLQMTEKGTPTPTLTNAALALSHAPVWRGVFRLDTFAGRVGMGSAPPWHAGPFAPAEVTDADISQVAIWMQDNGIRITSALAFEAINVAARRDQFHPVRDYLAGLTWDGVARLDTWLTEHLGAEDTRLTRAIAARFVISMVARVSRPGCKVDTVLILEGRQGLRKSSALSALARGWFTDHMPDLSSKDAALQIQGVVLVEFAELDKLHRAEAARAKAFISTAVDRLRRPYGKTTEDFPRQCVFAATVNPGSTGYLEDETGNRRFWPVACGVEWPDHRQVDLTALLGVVDQLWAEARSRYMAGAAWWLDADDLDDAQANIAVQRVTSDVWEPQIAQYLASLEETSVSEVLDQCIRKPIERRTKVDMMRVAAVVKGLGWGKRRVSIGDGAREWRYFRTSGVVQLNRINAESLSSIL